jgi:NAD(P)-dependent dehydrogenase (short-subunit alcohol dehydrogenase family)
MAATLVGKVAIVTPAAGGIGAEVAATLARDGAAVVVADIDLPRSELVAKEIRAAGGEAAALPVDLASESSVTELIDATAARYGGVDIPRTA